MAMIGASSITPMISSFDSNKSVADVNEPITFEFTADVAWHADIAKYYIDFHDGTQYQELGPSSTDIIHSFQYEGKYVH